MTFPRPELSYCFRGFFPNKCHALKFKNKPQTTQHLKADITYTFSNFYNKLVNVSVHLEYLGLAFVFRSNNKKARRANCDTMNVLLRWR